MREMMEDVRQELIRASSSSLLFGDTLDGVSARLLLVELEGITEKVRLLVGPEAAELARSRAMASPGVAKARAAMASPSP